VIRVLVADDHPMFLFGLQAVLNEADGIEVAGTASDGTSLLALVDRESPDVVITDLSMDGVDGIEVIRTLTGRSRPIPVVALTMHADDAHVRAALRAGATGYILKGANATAITAAVRAAASGQSAFDATVSRRMAEAYAGDRSSESHLFPELTSRERDVLRLIGEGCANHEIARRLSLADKTVRNLTSNILLKLAVPDRTSAALRAREAGLSGHPGDIT
jgi:DNA-binding NarL/FixJ family response regulator